MLRFAQHDILAFQQPADPQLAEARHPERKHHTTTLAYVHGLRWFEIWQAWARI